MIARLAAVVLALGWAGTAVFLISAALAAPPAAATVVAIPTELRVVVDDFRPQPLITNPIYFYNRLGGDRGALNESQLTWGRDEVTMTIGSSQSWGGVWTSLNHPVVEGEGIDFSAALPAPIVAAYQPAISGIALAIDGGTAGRQFRLELKEGVAVRWSQTATLSGGPQTIAAALPPLGEMTELVWLLDGAQPGDYVVVRDVALTATTAVTDPLLAAFAWSYGMWLENWNPATGLARDKARDPSGAFDAVQATGALAGGTAVAWQLGVVEPAAAISIVNRISQTLLGDLPRYEGLWPHWVETIMATGALTIAENSEWSTVDTAIAAIGLLEAQQALGLETGGTEAMLAGVNWPALRRPNGLSHGYDYGGTMITYTWDSFGGESWLLGLAYAAATGNLPPVRYPHPPTANGSGFIDELAWLFAPPPDDPDAWGVDWNSYRVAATAVQRDYYANELPGGCFDQLGLFGLSAAEVPEPAGVTTTAIYQPFGVGGRFVLPNDGRDLLGAPVAVPHYAGMIADLEPAAAGLWSWLIDPGPFSPLNNVESLLFADDGDCTTGGLTWNHLKGSWNLALQTLGLGAHLAHRDNQPPILWTALGDNAYLLAGYERLVQNTVNLPTVLR